MGDSKKNIWVCLNSYACVCACVRVCQMETKYAFVKDGYLICAIGLLGNVQSPLRLSIFAHTHWTGAQKDLPILRICGIFWKVFIGVSLGK